MGQSATQAMSSSGRSSNQELVERLAQNYQLKAVTAVMGDLSIVSWSDPEMKLLGGRPISPVQLEIQVPQTCAGREDAADNESLKATMQAAEATTEILCLAAISHDDEPLVWYRGGLAALSGHGHGGVASPLRRWGVFVLCGPGGVPIGK
mmetsp:Transcript_8620/g.19665  ORF Transcript_8620/g.19665 Transcript_8620/m.19665 type:complete len:150 (-) Transcript_8620:199-648(-)|eukprot:CAMPEP_0197920460 /NCGR_PEP_ID=MMETSP1439-20131203/88989_1 /TAXON_ID=66791 /ORGANISM="Gonyaulax spinifera, Strain CCMP409" /LENGTH=149 /DNA_ID=CAMNT_0043542663 /DNA_START=80 /DNA_END=529 /DNA_ORIENTATION=-